MLFGMEPEMSQNSNIERLRELADDLGRQWNDMHEMTERFRTILLAIRGATNFEAIQTIIREADKLTDEPTS